MNPRAPEVAAQAPEVDTAVVGFALVTVRVVLAVVLAVVGMVWIFQGVGTLEGSFMTGQGEWTAIGIVVDLFAAASLLGALRARRDERDLDEG